MSSSGPGTSGRPAGDSFLSGEPLSSSCQKQKGGETCEDWSSGDAPGPAGSPFNSGWRGAYRLGRSCRSFFTQGTSGSTQTLSRLFNLILENTRCFQHHRFPLLQWEGSSSQTPPPGASRKKRDCETERIQGGRGRTRGLVPPPGATYITSRRRQLLPTGRTSMLLYFRGGMKALVVLAQRQLRLPLASRRAGGAHGRASRMARKPAAIPKTLSGQRRLPPRPTRITAPTCERASAVFKPRSWQRDAASKNLTHTHTHTLQHPPAPLLGAWGASPASPGRWVTSSTPSSRATRAAMPAPSPALAASPYLSQKIGEVRWRRREAPGAHGVGVVFAHLRSLLTALAELAMPLIKRVSGLVRGPGSLKPALFSLSYEAGSCKDIGRFPQRLFLAHAAAQAWRFLGCFLFFT